MMQLWGWTATDQFGRSREYQARGPDVTESAMLEFMRNSMKNATITNMRRLEDREYKPATGSVESHLYHLGHMEKWNVAHGIETPSQMFAKGARLINRGTIDRAGVARSPILRVT
jgi:hypothetical protein